MATLLLNRPSATFVGVAGTTTTITAALDNVPPAFLNATAVSLAASTGTASYVSLSDDTITLNVRIMSGATVLAAVDSGGTYQNLIATSAIAETKNTSSVSFSYVNTGASASLWDDAVIEYEQVYLQNMGPDGGYATIDTVSNNITVEYTEATGTIFNYWSGSAWLTGQLKYWDGATWQPALVQRWNGSSWEPA